MTLSDTMVKQLNEQITAEFAASHAYLAMSCELEGKGLTILSAFFAKQAEEERAHAIKILKYLQEVDGEVRLEAVEKPRGDYGDVAAIAEAALKSEEHVTKLIHDLVALAEKEKDYATRSFLNWFVDEQVEEVASMKDLVQMVKLAGNNLLQLEARIRHQVLAPAS